MATSTIGFRIDRTQERTVPRISKRTLFRVAIVVGAAAIAAALALLPDPAHAASTPVVVKMSDKQPYYAPEKVTVKAGDTVEWVNNGDTIHSVSTEAANAQDPKDVSLPSGA